MNHRNRSGCFALLFAALGAHMFSQGASPLAWGLLGFQFLIYPQLMYWRAVRSSDPVHAELNNMRLDALLFGGWAAALAFPLWISFILFIGATVNLTAFHGRRGFERALGLLLLGALAATLAWGFQVSPHTDWPATALSIVCVSLFTIIIAEGACTRARKLYDTREQLRLSEQALKTANKALEQRLDENTALQALLSEQAQRDPLTGLYNRRYFDATLQREMARCTRERQPLSLMLIDVDFFKKINDGYGHQAGDEVLKKLALFLNQRARATDIVCRFGGEEFLVLLPNMPSDIAFERAEQWRLAFAESHTLLGELRLSATMSIGIATFPDDGTAPQELIQCADQAMYQAKSQGRNRVVTYQAEATLQRKPQPYFCPSTSGSDTKPMRISPALPACAIT